MQPEQKYYTNTFLIVNLTLIYYNERVRSVSSYVYCFQNPVKFIDPTGMGGEEPWPIISPVIPKNKFVGWGRAPFYQLFINRQATNGVLPKNPKQPACADYAKEQLRVVGYATSGGSTQSNMYPYSETTGVNKEETLKAIEYIKEQLTNGVPVFAGVDDAK